MKRGDFLVRRGRAGPACKRSVIGCIITSPLAISSPIHKKARWKFTAMARAFAEISCISRLPFVDANIPARYVTGYLGDIGVPPAPYPMDFSAWFEVFLGGKWHTFDARHNQRRIGRILVAVGRDAADVALTTNFGSAKLLKFHVITEEVK